MRESFWKKAKAVDELVTPAVKLLRIADDMEEKYFKIETWNSHVKITNWVTRSDYSKVMTVVINHMAPERWQWTLDIVLKFKFADLPYVFLEKNVNPNSKNEKT